MIDEIEEWRAIPGWPIYEASNLGRIRSLERVVLRKDGRIQTKPGTIRVQGLDHNGYPQVGLHSANRKRRMAYVSHLVLEAFVGPRPTRYNACHYPDPNPLNNRLDNLHWDTAIANQKDRELHGTANIGEQNPGAKLTIPEVLLIRKLWDAGIHPKKINKEIPRISKTQTYIVGQRKAWKSVPEATTGVTL